MDISSAALLRQLLRTQRIAALGTLRDGAPLVSMTLYLPTPDFSAFHIHVSALAWHTQDMQRDPRVSLLIAATDGTSPADDPYSLPRLTLRARASRLENDAPGHAALREAWLAKYPAQAVNFELADFSFWRLVPNDARFVAGYGRIMNLGPAELVAACA
jgi:putative heme iron utilization protein